MAHILILGGGFAGLVAAEQLAAAFTPGAHQITLVSRSPQFVFYPALVKVAFGALEPADIRFDLAAKLARLGGCFIAGDALKINPEMNAAEIYGDDFDGQIFYDYLIIAPGRRLATEKVGGFFEHAHHLLGVDAALKFGEATKNFRNGNIVVGMCPDARLPVPVCETAFALARRFEREIEQKKVSISVVFPETVAAAFGGAKIGYELEWAFEKHRINLIERFPIEEIEQNQIYGRGEQKLEHNLLMLVPPFRGNILLGKLGETIADAADYARVNGLMQVNGLSQTYAAGDIAAFSGPKMAHMAVRQARVAADNVIAEIIGETPQTEYYHEIATVIDASDADSIHLHYGIWDDELYALQKGTVWSWAKSLHDKFWLMKHA